MFIADYDDELNKLILSYTLFGAGKHVFLSPSIGLCYII